MKKMQGACDQIGTSPEYIKNLSNQEGFAPRFDARRGYENKVNAGRTGYSIDAGAFEKPAFDQYRSVERKNKISGYISFLASLRRNSFGAWRDASIQIVSIAQPPRDSRVFRLYAPKTTGHMTVCFSERLMAGSNNSICAMSAENLLKLLPSARDLSSAADFGPAFRSGQLADVLRPWRIARSDPGKTVPVPELRAPRKFPCNFLLSAS